MNVVTMSPHGYFGQSNVLGLPDTGGQVGGMVLTGTSPCQLFGVVMQPVEGHGVPLCARDYDICSSRLAVQAPSISLVHALPCTAARAVLVAGFMHTTRYKPPERRLISKAVY